MLAHSKLPTWVPPSLTPVVTFVAFSPLTFNLVLSTVPEREPFQHGAAIVNGAFGILPGHQMTISEFVSRRLLLLPADSPGLPPTILGGFYLDFGTAGIVVGMLLVGVVSQYLYWRMFERPSLWAVFFYAYWSFNLLVALYGDLIANDLIWFIPLAVYGIHLALGWMASSAPTRAAVA
jgi:oligosaccharide repeat unit polymerase